MQSPQANDDSTTSLQGTRHHVPDEARHRVPDEARHRVPHEAIARDAARRRNYRRAIAVSILLHLVLIAVLFFWYLPTTTPSNNNGSLTSSSNTAASSADSTQAGPGTEARIPGPEIASPEIPAEQIEASIDSQIEAVTPLSEDRKLTELEKNLSRLEAIASEDSVRDVTTTIAASLGLEPGPVAADQPPAGPFDSESAQILDIKREKDLRGQWQYTSLLVDAKGRTQEVPLPSAEGETAFRTFEQLKQYPIADGIYRQVVMPMIQRMIQASEFAEKAAAEASQFQNESPPSATDASPDNSPSFSNPPSFIGESEK